MSNRFIMCDGCGESSTNKCYFVEFLHNGFLVCLCDECIEAASRRIKNMKAKDEDA